MPRNTIIIIIISERERENVNSRSRSLYAVARLSVCVSSVVCLSSVTLVQWPLFGVISAKSVAFGAHCVKVVEDIHKLSARKM